MRIYKNIPKKVKLYGNQYDLYTNFFGKLVYDNVRDAEKIGIKKAQEKYKKVYAKLIQLKRPAIFGNKEYVENVWVIYVREKR